MTKVKINSGLMALMITASLFAGWQTMLLVAVLLFAFFEVDDRVKNVAIKVITFYIAINIVSAGWDLIVDGVNLVFSSFTDIIKTIGLYLEDPIETDKLYQYVITPITNIVKIADGIVGYLFVFVKLGFVISVLTGKNQKDNVITNKINDFVGKALSFINSYEAPVMAANNGMQMPVQNQMPAQAPGNPQNNVVNPEQNNIV